MKEYTKTRNCNWCKEEYKTSGYDHATGFSILFITSPWWKHIWCSELCYIKGYGKLMNTVKSVGNKCAEYIDKIRINAIKESC